MRTRHEAGETDEFIKPVGVLADGGLADGDTFLCFNYRNDRAREMFEAMSVAPPFATDVRRTPALCVSFTKYNAAFTSPMVFPPQKMTDGLAETFSKAGLTQLHVAETEKYAHVTFFFNGGAEDAYAGEERVLLPSPKVATYDVQPEMNARGVADCICEQIAASKHSFIVANFAPPDMVGHTGVMEKAIVAAAHTDAQLGRVVQACKAAGYALFITADHGNCETMLTEDNSPHTAHSTTKVPFVAMLPDCSTTAFNRSEGGLADIAPTILTYMGVPVPPVMTGKSLL